MRTLTLVIATVLALSFAGCGEKKKEGDSCKRHSECMDGLICSSVDQKCHTPASARATRKAAAADEKAERLKAVSGGGGGEEEKK